jgi:hypothetical protein
MSDHFAQDSTSRRPSDNVASHLRCYLPLRKVFYAVIKNINEAPVRAIPRGQSHSLVGKAERSGQGRCLDVNLALRKPVPVLLLPV